MKRVQLILEEWQHNWLAEEAKAQKTTISAMTRQLLTEAIERQQANVWQDDPIWGIVGLGTGPDDGINSENLDEFLYPQPEASSGARLLRVAENEKDYHS